MRSISIQFFLLVVSIVLATLDPHVALASQCEDAAKKSKSTCEGDDPQIAESQARLEAARTAAQGSVQSTVGQSANAQNHSAILAGELARHAAVFQTRCGQESKSCQDKCKQEMQSAQSQQEKQKAQQNIDKCKQDESKADKAGEQQKQAEQKKKEGEDNKGQQSQGGQPQGGQPQSGDQGQQSKPTTPTTPTQNLAAICSGPEAKSNPVCTTAGSPEAAKISSSSSDESGSPPFSSDKAVTEGPGTEPGTGGASRSVSPASASSGSSGSSGGLASLGGAGAPIDKNKKPEDKIKLGSAAESGGGGGGGRGGGGPGNMPPEPGWSAGGKKGLSGMSVKPVDGITPATGKSLFEKVTERYNALKPSLIAE